MARGSFSEDPSRCHQSLQGHDTCPPALGEIQMSLLQQDKPAEASWLTLQLLLGLRELEINAQNLALSRRLNWITFCGPHKPNLSYDFLLPCRDFNAFAENSIRAVRVILYSATRHVRSHSSPYMNGFFLSQWLKKSHTEHAMSTQCSRCLSKENYPS